MAEAREKSAWNRTADLIANLANIHCGTEENPAPYRRADFHPFLPSPRVCVPKSAKEEIAKLKALVPKGRT